MKTELIIGQKYGKWTIVRFDLVDNLRRRRYICRCECGVEKSLIASAVAAGRTKSCLRCKSDDLVGQTFGMWTVIARSDEKSKNRFHTLWLCECTCGSQHLVERCNLVREKSKGCWVCRRDVIETSRFPRAWYRQLIEQAKLRGWAFELSEEELWKILEAQNGKCPLTGMDIEVTGSYKTITASVDRIRNDLGYVAGNVWFIHKYVNMMKYKYDIEYFIEMCGRVTEHAQARISD